MTLDVALCICTSGRPEVLERALKSIQPARAHLREVIVGDDSPPDRRAFIRDLCVRYGADYYVGPRRGLCANRNAVIATSNARYISLIDDDACLTDSFAEIVAGVLSDDPLKTIFTGNVVEDSGLAGPTTVSYLGYFAPTSRNRPPTVFHLNANLIPREALLLEPFDEAIQYGYEDVDVAQRLRWRGYTIRHLPELTNVHRPPGQTSDSTAARSRAQRVARVLVGVRRRKLERGPVTAYPAMAAFVTASSVHACAHALRAGIPFRDVFADLAQAVALYRRLGVRPMTIS